MSDFKKKKPESERKTEDTSWNTVSSWYDELVESGEGTYQSDCILPNVLRLLELKKGEKVLDLGFGQGFFSREFFKSGAEVTGVDLSKNLITLAEKQSPKEITFFFARGQPRIFEERFISECGVYIGNPKYKEPHGCV